MLNLPTIHATTDAPGTAVYVTSTPLDYVRIHCVMLADGTAVPVLFVGQTIFRLADVDTYI